ncbi:MAG: hypothetical protein IJA55_00835 [Clostridia bacterium]|nr:hypothetical protein [Clostridia bacterium]
MQKFLYVLKTVAGILPFVLLCLANFKINLNKANRSRQFLFPFIALLYGILGMRFLDKINILLERLFDLLVINLPILQKISWKPISTYVLNTALIIGFIVIKLFLMPIVSGIWKSKKVSEYTSGWFYDREEDVDKWLLKPYFANFRGYVKGFFIASFVASIVVFVMSQNFPKSVFFNATFYPVFGILVLSEVVFFLSGLTKSEFIEVVLGEDEESYTTANYGVLRQILRDLFGDRVMYENTLDSSDGISDTFDELDEMARSEDENLNLIGAYFLNLKANGVEIDINYVKSSVNLLNGKSSLFCNPFYRDLTPYITLAVVKQLISYRKCLFILGRDSSLDDVKDWIDSGLEQFSNTNSLWQSKVLDEYGNVNDVGIIRFSDLHNLKIHQANKEFLEKVGFVFIVEPSRILASGQIGLSLLVNNCESSDKDIVYCACDRNCDGLVDALSHTLRTSITEVTATVNGTANTSHMYWNADGKYMHHKILPNISRYLGIGTEINAVAMKYQIDHTAWIGSEKFPVADMKWIAGQYHRQICRYADIPESQAAFDRSFNVYSNIWSAEKRENSFLVVEDEFQNLFEITRVFASRAKNQGFINIISENYLLRDYMLDNVDVFMSDPKAIPTIVPDFARTERNMVLRLIMMMVYDAVSEERIAKELMLCGISFEDPYHTLKELILKHCRVSDASLSVKFKEEIELDSLNSISVKYYEINEANELYEYAQLLKNAYYIAEDEEGESHYIGAKLYGHIFQAMLPGQFMTNDGKYYEVQTVTPFNGVVVRRAADHITQRKYYKQLRRVHLDNWTDSTEMGSKRITSDIEITRGYADITVETDGYLEMNMYGDLANAKSVALNGIPARNYRNKSVLMVKFPDGISARTRYTLCLLLNEIFRTTYPETHHYLSALTPYSDEMYSENLKDALYRLNGDCDSDCIYIVEDSDIDLGLIVSVERNLKRYLEIVAEVLIWHEKKMVEVPEDDDETDKEFVPQFTKKKKPGILERIKRFFGRRKSAETEVASVPEEASETVDVPEIQELTEDTDTDVNEEGIGEDVIQTPDATDSELEERNTEEPAPLFNRTSRTLYDLADEDIDGEDEQLAEPPRPTEYQNRCFMKFGYEDFDAVLDISGTIELLVKLGFDKNPLQQVREKNDEAKGDMSAYDPHKYGVHYCDFCGVELLGGEYDVLKDGRERCNRCSMTAIKKVDDFRVLYKTVLRNMEAFYGIKLNVAVKVRTANAKVIAKNVGMKFVPTPGFDGRVLGFARKDKTGYSLYIENGSPKLAAAATIAHELTHIWQYTNWNDAALSRLYGRKNMLEVYEGMAKWAEIQYLMLMNEKSYAKRQEITTRMRDDEYGRGFIIYTEKYPLCDDSKVKRTPFKENPPL